MSKFLGLAVAGFATLAAAQASAATSVQTFYTGSSPFTTAPAQDQPFPFTNTLSVASFDASTGGTLNSVTIAVSGTVTVLSRVSNNGSSGQTESFVEAQASVPVRVSFVSGGVTTTVTNTTFVSGEGDGSVPVGATVTASSLANAVGTSSNVALAPFIGTGASAVALQVRGGALAASGIGVDNVTFFGGTALANLTLTVTYDFTPAVVVPPTGVPEPASLALLGLGLAAVGMVRRRRA